MGPSDVVYVEKRSGPITDPWGTPVTSWCFVDTSPPGYLDVDVWVLPALLQRNPVATCEVQVNSMLKRVKSVLVNNGGHTKYWHFGPNLDISLRGVLTFVASGLDINGCVLSYFEGTANLHCYTSCTLTTLYCSKVSFVSVVTWKAIIKYLQKCEWCTHFCELLYIYIYIYIYIYVCVCVCVCVCI